MSSSSEFTVSGRTSRQGPARSPEKSLSNFTQTCSMLSQYLKEKKGGAFGDLSLGMNRSFDANVMPETFLQTATTTATTMNLFPVVSGASTRIMAPRNLKSMDLFPQQSGLAKEEVPKKVDSSVAKSQPETAQMTIFYAGKVIVFNDLPADKANEIMLLASKESSHKNLGNLATRKRAHPVHETPAYAEITPAQKMAETSSGVVSNISNNMTQEHVQRPPQPIVTDLPKIARKASLTRFLEKRKDRITARAPYLASNSTEFPPKPAENKSWLGLAAQSPVQFEGQMY